MGRFGMLAIVCLMTCPLVVRAAEKEEALSPPPPQKTEKQAQVAVLAPTTQESAPQINGEAKIWSLSGGVDFTNQYFFRGIKQEDQGLITQPYGELAIKFYEGSEGKAVNSLSVFGGNWNSIHSGPTGHDDATGTRDNPKSWYESDFYGGVRGTFFDKINTDVFYTCYYSPNGSFGAVHELATKVAFNDADCLGDWALSPYVLMAFELSNEADAGNNSKTPGFHQGGYMELGIEPKWDPFKSKSLPVTFSFPVKVGLSMYDYFQDSTTDSSPFGYASFGVWANMPLTFIPKEAGVWTFSLGGTLMVLGPTTSNINDNRQLAGIGTARLTVSF